MDTDLSNANNTHGNWFYRLLYVIEDEQNNAMVDKLSIPRDSIAKLSNATVPNSSKDDAMLISFADLDKANQLIFGVWGITSMIIDFLKKRNIISSEHLSKFGETKSPAVYGIRAKYTDPKTQDQGVALFVVFWPSRNSFGEIGRGNVACKILRSLHAVCRHVFVFMDDAELSKMDDQVIQTKSRFAKFNVEKKLVQEDRVAFQVGREQEIKQILNFNSPANKEFKSSTFLSSFPVQGAKPGYAHRFLLPEDTRFKSENIPFSRYDLDTRIPDQFNAWLKDYDIAVSPSIDTETLIKKLIPNTYDQFWVDLEKQEKEIQEKVESEQALEQVKIRQSKDEFQEHLQGVLVRKIQEWFPDQFGRYFPKEKYRPAEDSIFDKYNNAAIAWEQFKPTGIKQLPRYRWATATIKAFPELLKSSSTQEFKRKVMADTTLKDQSDFFNKVAKGLYKSE